MVNKVARIDTYSFQKSDKLIFDTNVWLYLFAPPSSSSYYVARVYSEAFKTILKAKSELFITSLVLSEYVNRYCRIEWIAMHQRKYPNFKDFRKSALYSSVGQNAANYAENILSFSSRLDDGFSNCDIDSILKNASIGGADFNDGLIVDACLRNNLKLVTHDGDFVTGDIEIVTANGKLVTACA